MAKVQRYEEGHVLDYLNYEYFLKREESEVANQIKRKMLFEIVKIVYKSELTLQQRKVIYCTKIKGLKQKEVAKILRINTSTVNRHLKTALKKFDKGYRYFLACYRVYINENE